MEIENRASGTMYEVQNVQEQKLTLENIILIYESAEPVIKSFNDFSNCIWGLR